MAFQREFRILSCFLLLLFVAIQEGNADQRSESEKSLGLSRNEVEMDGRQRKLRDPLAVLHPAFQREFRACASTGTPDGTCAAEGQSLPDLHDCALFYRCEGATPAPVCYTCPAGTLFNPDINECDANYICTLDPACTTASEVFPDKDNCAGFLICLTATGTPEHVQCPPGQLFNVATLGCVDGAVNCNGRPVCLYEGQTLPSVYDCKEYYQCDAALVPQPKQCTGTDLFDADTNSCRAAPLANCAGALRTVSITSRDSSSEGFSCLYAGQSLPDDYDCSYYFICKQDLTTPTLTPKKYKCEYGYSWDSIKHTCVLTTIAACAVPPSEQTGRQSKLNDPLSVFQQEFQRQLRTCTATQTPDGTCTEGGQSLPDLHDCALFYRCEGATPAPVCYTCPDGTLFNPDINECVGNYYCTLDPACTTASEVFPDKDNCAGFKICLSATGSPTPVQCPTGQLFNVAIHGCEDSGVDCNGRPVCLYEGQTVPSVYNCNEYYQCDAALLPVKKSCPDNDNWDTDSNTCRAPALANCAEPPSTASTTSPDTSTEPPKCTQEGQTYADPYDCSAYFQCDAILRPNHHYCPAGQLFDSASGTCQPAATVTCTVSTYPTIETTTGSSTVCTSPGQVIYSPTDCRTFYTCDAGLVPRTHSCNPLSQLYYDPAYGNCNYYSRVVCSGGMRPQPTPTAFPNTGTPPPPATVQCLQPGQFIANTLNCRTFYKCSEVLFPELFNCPPDLLFHSATGCCDTSAYAVCATE